MLYVDRIHPSARSWQVHPDARRIAAYAGAIALNLTLLMLVSLPLQQGPLPAIRKDGPVVTVVDLPEPKPEVVPVVPHLPSRPLTPVQHTRPQVQAPPVDVPVVVPDSSEAYVPPTDTTPVDTTPVDTGPVTGMSLEYASAPPPAYPRQALREGITGTVLLEVLVDVDGSPLQVSIHRSSGHRELDRAAQQQVLRHWRFRPASRNGAAVQAIGIVPIDFRLD